MNLDQVTVLIIRAVVAGCYVSFDGKNFFFPVGSR